MNYEQARLNMIEQQIRTWDVLDQNVLDLCGQIHREDFIPDPYKKLALADVNIPLGHGEITMQPKLEARILQTLTIQPDDTILEIGTGCGYLTALLARAGGTVHSVDIYPDFTASAEQRLLEHAIVNAKLHSGDALRGWPAAAPYDVIVVTGSVPEIYEEYRQQLTLDGRLFVISGDSPAMEACLITRSGAQEWRRESLFETDLPPLVGATRTHSFSF